MPETQPYAGAGKIHSRKMSSEEGDNGRLEGQSGRAHTCRDLQHPAQAIYIFRDPSQPDIHGRRNPAGAFE